MVLRTSSQNKEALVNAIVERHAANAAIDVIRDMDQDGGTHK